MRLATYIGARKKGLSPRASADRTMRHHFDYGDLSPFESDVARRVLPFYTFTARNIPLQAKSILTNPGKYATLAKAREEVARAQGINLQEWERENLQEHQRRALPFPLKVGTDDKGKPVIFGLSLGAVGFAAG